MPIYIDTSALAKRYLSERGSEVFDAFLAAQDDECVICPLGATELESMLQRLQRECLITASFAQQVRRDFAADLSAALWSMRPFEAASFALATQLMRSLQAPLASLDALHLACSIELACTSFATGDRQLARAAAEHGLQVHSFIV